MATAAEPGVQVFNDIRKGKNDTRQYRGLILKNGLKVMLIQDADLKMSAAAMDVNIGASSDPSEMAGLAHFVEHMIFAGSKKYPTKNFSEFVRKQLGYCTGQTSMDDTSYSFDIRSEHFEAALDRIAQFFIEGQPMFAKEHFENEMLQIKIEYETKCSSTRSSELCALADKEICDQTHDFAKFEPGNWQTLKADLKDQLRAKAIDFHSRLYSANVMALCVLDRRPLDELQVMVTKRLPFNRIKNKNVKAKQTSKYDAFKREHLSKVIKIPNEHPLGEMWVDFIVPLKLAKYLFMLTTWLHNGNSVIVSPRTNSDYLYTPFRLGYLYCEPEPQPFSRVVVRDGSPRAEQIVAVFFRYVHELKKHPADWKMYYDSLKALEQFNWDHRDKLQEDYQPPAYATAIAFQMHRSPFKDVLCDNKLTSEFEVDLFGELLDEIKVDNLKLTIVSTEFASLQGTQKSKYWPFEYTVDEIPKRWLEQWANCDQEPLFSWFPKHLKYIPTESLKLVAPDPQARCVPERIKLDNQIAVWFFQDLDDKIPRSLVMLHLKNPALYRDALSITCMRLYKRMILALLNNLLSCFNLVGYSFELSNKHDGLMMRINGWSDQLLAILKECFDEVMLTRFVNKELFDAVKQRYLEECDYDPRTASGRLIDQVLNEFDLSVVEFAKCSASLIDYELFKATVKNFHKNLFVEIYMEGNVTRQDAEQVEALVRASLFKTCNASAIAKRHFAPKVQLKLPEGARYIVNRNFENFTQHALTTYYQFRMPDTPLNSMKVQLLYLTILQERFFTHFLENDPVVYEFIINLRRDDDVRAVSFECQSDEDPAYLDSFFEMFFEKSREYLDKLSDEALKPQKERLKIFYNSGRRKSDFCPEITAGTWRFLFNVEEASEVHKVTKQDLIETFDEIFGEKRKRISVRIYGSKAETKRNKSKRLPPPQKQPEIVVDDLLQFQRTLDCYPATVSTAEVEKMFTVQPVISRRQSIGCKFYKSPSERKS